MDEYGSSSGVVPFGGVGWRRWLALAGGVCAFLFLASVLRPFPSQAGRDEGDGGDGGGAVVGGSMSPEAISRGVEGGRLIGEFRGRELRVLVYSGGDGPRYVVLDFDGAELGSGLTAEELGVRFPDFDLSRLEMGTPMGAVPMMLHDSPR